MPALALVVWRSAAQLARVKEPLENRSFSGLSLLLFCWTIPVPQHIIIIVVIVAVALSAFLFYCMSPDRPVGWQGGTTILVGC